MQAVLGMIALSVGLQPPGVDGCSNHLKINHGEKGYDGPGIDCLHDGPGYDGPGINCDGLGKMNSSYVFGLPLQRNYSQSFFFKSVHFLKGSIKLRAVKKKIPPLIGYKAKESITVQSILTLIRTLS